MSTPRYFHFYDMPDFDARFGTDLAFTRRCEVASVPLYKLLATEVKFLRQVPSEYMSVTIWDLCFCAGSVVDRIPYDGWTLESTCEVEAPQLMKLARRFVEHNVAGAAVLQKFQELIDFVMADANIELSHDRDLPLFLGGHYV